VSDSSASADRSTAQEQAAQIAFDHLGDRFGHAVIIAGNAAPIASAAAGPSADSRPLEGFQLVSVEGTPEESWPASPALQQQLSGEGHFAEAALLLGMAGSSHWSLAAQVDQDGNVVIEVACRLKQKPVWLGSTYQLPRNVRAEWRSDELAEEALEVRLHGRRGSARVWIEPLEGRQTAIELLAEAVGGSAKPRDDRSGAIGPGPQKAGAYGPGDHQGGGNHPEAKKPGANESGANSLGEDGPTGLVIRPDVGESFPQTVRWRYGIGPIRDQA
jgi:hypothetical protein